MARGLGGRSAAHGLSPPPSLPPLRVRGRSSDSDGGLGHPPAPVVPASLCTHNDTIGVGASIGVGSLYRSAVVLIAPSILAADFAKLADEIASVGEHADWVHVDLMDGHFVPNLTIGPPVVASLRKHADLPLDCHLMVTEPGNWIEPLADAGADTCTIHVELGDPRPLLEKIGALGMRRGLVIDGPTPFEV